MKKRLFGEAIGLTMKYFVLNPNKNDAYGLASRNAISTYRDFIQKENPKLAEDLTAWIALINTRLENLAKAKPGSGD
jgi:hypothetical protein